MKNSKLLFGRLLLASAVAIAACNSSDKNAEPSALENETVDTLIQDKKSFNYVLPSPLQIASIFHRAKLKFDDKLVNKVESSSKYNTETKLNLNIGVYATDLAYCLLNSQNQLSLNYLKVSRDLSDKIGMGSIYDTEALVDRFQNNINNIDSLADIISTIQTESEAFLEENERRFTALSIFAGAWVEAIYIASKSIENNYNEKIVREIAEQHVSLRNLIKLLNEHEEAKQPEFNDVLARLTEINVVYENSADYKAKPIEEGEEMPLDFILTPEELKSLAEKVSGLRNLIIN